MRKQEYTHYEDGEYFSVITTSDGFTYYSKGFETRAKAYYYAKKENKKHQNLPHKNMVYNAKI